MTQRCLSDVAYQTPISYHRSPMWRPRWILSPTAGNLIWEKKVALNYSRYAVDLPNFFSFVCLRHTRPVGCLLRTSKRALQAGLWWSSRRDKARISEDLSLCLPVLWASWRRDSAESEIIAKRKPMKTDSSTDSSTSPEKLKSFPIMFLVQNLNR